MSRDASRNRTISPFADQAQAISTQGGAYVEGSLAVGHDFIGRDKNIYGDEIGRDKIIYQSTLILQHTRSAVDEAQRVQVIEAEALAEGVNSFVKRLLSIATQDTDALEGGPYRGLIAYEMSDAEIFFGRERAVDVLGEHLRQSKLTVIQSESGAGKSSLLRAGVAPRLLAGGHLPLIIRPYDQAPGAKIKQEFLHNLAQVPALAAAPLRDFLHRVVTILGNDATLFLILDQFEEFFTLVQKAEEQNAFINDLAECLEDPTLDVRWVLALRSEFFGDLAKFRPRVQNPFQNNFRLNRLTAEEARAVIIKPAALCRVDYEPRLVDQLIADLLQPDGEIAPPQVQLICQALYKSYMDRKVEAPDLPPTITLDFYRHAGEAHGILHNHLNRVFSRSLPSEEEQKLARRILTFLISSDQRRVRHTYSVLVRQLTATSIDKQRFDKVLVELVDNRLVNAERSEQDSVSTYELAHDYLVSMLELDPEAGAQKLAQELLHQEVIIRRQYHAQEELITRNRLELIERYLPIDSLTAEEADLVRRSRERINQIEQTELERVKQALFTQSQLTLRTRVLLALVTVVTGALAIQPVQRFIWRYWAANSIPVIYVNEAGVEFEAYEVSNERYAWCVDSGACNRPNNFSQIRENWEQYKHKPVVNIDAIDAMNFCAWVGRTLPTAEQWLAAAPPVDQWRELSSDEALFCRNGNSCTLDEVGTRGTAQYSPSPESKDEGVFDLAGSVYEWTRTVINGDSSGNNQCVDAVQPGGNERAIVVLGDAWNMPLDAVGNYQDADVSRSQRLSSRRYDTVGFRCVSKNSYVSPAISCPSMQQ